MKILTAMVAMLMLSVGVASATNCPDGSYWAANDAVAYANSVAATYGTVDDAGNAVGVEDGQYARIHDTGPDSYLVLDMGEGEEVWDRVGLDLKIFEDNSEEYYVDVYVSNSPNSGFQFVGSTDGDYTEEFYLGGTGYSSIRYVKIVNNNDNDNVVRKVEIDAVKGYCISNPTNEVPEFGTVGAALALLGAGFVAYKKRK